MYWQHILWCLSNRSLLRQRKEETWLIGLEHLVTWSAQPKQKMAFGRCLKWPPERRCRHAGERAATNAVCCEYLPLDSVPVLGLKKSVCEGHTPIYTVIPTSPAPPLTFARCFWERDPRKKSFVLSIFPPFGLIFSHGDVYQYLRELGQMGPFLMLYLNHSSLPICQMLSCDPAGWLERCDPGSRQSLL